MKRLFTLITVAVAVASGFIADAQVFDKGDRKIDLTVGVGVIKQPTMQGEKNKATFDQHFGMEWGVAKFTDKFTLGVGFSVNNAYGGTYESPVAGTYNYQYNYSEHGKVFKYSTDKWERISVNEKRTREGVGTADADVSREDINIMPTIAFHYSPMSCLDVYVKIGVGVGVMNYLFSNFRNENGFKSVNINNHNENKLYDVYTTYSYNDLDHVKWEGYETRVTASVAAYIGATYMLTEKWGLDAQLGLVSSCLKESKYKYPASYSIFAIGASYRF